MTDMGPAARRVVVLAGGYGGAKLSHGLALASAARAEAGEAPLDLAVIVNTGDDLELHGLCVSPDLDTVMYTLSGWANEATGWGVRDETWSAKEMLTRYGAPTWFGLGDRDIATHLVVTLPDAVTAASVASELGTKTLANSGWHVYSNMEHLRSRRIVSGFASAVADYVAEPGSLPATDALLSRSITIGVGVVDPGIGSAFGINVRSTADDIDRVAARFRSVVGRHV